MNAVLEEVRLPEGLLLNDLGDIDGVKVLTERVKKRKDAYSEAKARPHICADRSRLATQSWKETEGEHVYLRRAKLFARICEQVPIAIFDGELVVGSQTQYARGCSPPLDWSRATAKEVLAGGKNVGRSEVLQCDIPDEVFAAIKEDAAYWQDKSPEDVMRRMTEQHFNMNWADLVAPGIDYSIFSAGTPAWSRDADYGKVLQIGPRGSNCRSGGETQGTDVRERR